MWKFNTLYLHVNGIFEKVYKIVIEITTHDELQWTYLGYVQIKHIRLFGTILC